MYKKLLLFCLAALVALPVFAGGASQTSGEAVSAHPTGKITYPLKTDVTLTYWTELPAAIAPYYRNASEVPFYKGWLERTGVKVTYLHPPIDNQDEQFNLMVASNDLPDIVRRDVVRTYVGGPEKAISDGVIIEMNDIIDNYAPNLKEVLTKNPQWAQMAKTDNGTYYNFPNFRSDVGLCIWQGLQVRRDWMDELGIAPPETYDDWRAMLTAFKTRKNSPAPLALNFKSSAFMYGYGIDVDWYVGNDGKVQWGRIQGAYRDYLEMMSRWYKEGLLDPDTASLTPQQIAAKITGGVSGAVHGSLNGNMGLWLPTGRATDPKFSLIGIKNPVRAKGDTLTMINVDMPYSGSNGCVSITGASKNREIAARFLDWGYSPEGYMYHNFGTPGVSYNMVNGYPTLTDLILKNPDGWPIGTAISAYIHAAYGGPHVQALEYWQQILAHPEQREALTSWEIDEPFKHKIPSITPTPEESQEMARIMAEINSYADEMMVKYILGTEPLSSFDSYVETAKRMGIDRALEIQNAALVRYNNR